MASNGPMLILVQVFKALKMQCTSKLGEKRTCVVAVRTSQFRCFSIHALILAYIQSDEGRPYRITVNVLLSTKVVLKILWYGIMKN